MYALTLRANTLLSEDFSNYWTAVLYFKARNGSYKRVQQYPNALLGSLTGGMTVYYMQQDFNSNGKQKITSFKPVRFRTFLQVAY